MPHVREEPVTPMRERLICDCGTEMQAEPFSYLSDPPQYPHRCGSCGAEKSMPKKYPAIIFKDPS
jgi:hypothetical protein